jgi:1,5-anhydro-D-fructose reductase (1,5-anhydro-D-mannitol-forming)
VVRFGIAGFGLHAVKRLMPAFSRSQRCRVTALSRRTLAAAQQSAAEYKIPYAFDSVAEMSGCAEVDAVLVTTPNSSHLANVLAVVHAGKHVLCEKPLGMNAAECKQMVEAAREGGVRFGVAHVMRFNQSVRKLRELVSAGRIGKPVFARTEFSFVADPTHPRTWLYNAAVAGAGPIFDLGVHCIDTLRHILEDEVVAVSANAVRDHRSGDVETAGLLNLEFSCGTLAAAMVSFRAPYRTPIEIVGETGVLYADHGLSVDHPVEVQLRREGRVVESTTTSNNLAYTLQLDAFADAIEGRSPFPIPGEEGWQNQEVLDAALRSLRKRTAENVRRISG